jgi:hypothetical protein
VPDPFRDEEAATLERQAALEAENEELRTRFVAIVNGELGKLVDEGTSLEQRISQLENDALQDRVQIKLLEERTQKALSPTLAGWTVGVTIVAFLVGAVIGTFIGAH